MRVRFYRGQFNPAIDRLVKDNLALSVQDFGLLPKNRQEDIISENTVGDPGVPNPDPDYVPPYMRKGLTFAELMKLFEKDRETIKEGFKRKSADDILRQNLESTYQQQSSSQSEPIK